MACCLGFSVTCSVYLCSSRPPLAVTLSFCVTSKHGQTGWSVSSDGDCGNFFFFFFGGAIKFPTVPNLRWLLRREIGLAELQAGTKIPRRREGKEWLWNRNQVFKRAEEEGIRALSSSSSVNLVLSCWWTAPRGGNQKRNCEYLTSTNFGSKPLTNIRKADK